MANTVKIVVTAIDHASKTFKDVGSTATQMEKGLKSARIPLLATTAAISGAGVASVKFASDLEEAQNKAQVTFKESAGVIDRFAADSARSYGLSARAANEYTGTLGTILNASGLASSASADMSVELVKLAADLASFNNIPIDIALEKLRAGLVGEVEPLRTVGVLLSQAEVEAYALREGMIGVGESMTEAQKVQARYGLILEQTANQQGDFQRTADSAANSMRILQAQTEDAAASLGRQLLPAAKSTISALSTGVETFNNTSDAFKSTTIAVAGTTASLAALGLAIPPVIGGVRALTTATAFLAANPIVALVAVIGAVAVGGTLLSALRKTKDESAAASQAMDDLTAAVDAAKIAAGEAGRTLSDEAAAVEALRKILDTAVSSADVYAAATVRQRDRNISAVQAQHEYEQAVADHNATIEAATNLVTQYGLAADVVEEVLRGSNLTHQDQARILEVVHTQTAKAIADQKGLADAHELTTKAMLEQQEAQKRALIEAAKATEEKLALVDAIAFAEKLRRGKENAEEILRQREEAAEETLRQEEEAAADLLAAEEEVAANRLAADQNFIDERTAYWADYYKASQEMQKQSLEKIHDDYEEALKKRRQLEAAYTPSLGGSAWSGTGNSINLFPDLSDPDLLEISPDLRALRDYFEAKNPDAIAPPRPQTPGQFVNVTVNGDVYGDDFEGQVAAAASALQEQGVM